METISLSQTIQLGKFWKPKSYRLIENVESESTKLNNPEMKSMLRLMWKDQKSCRGLELVIPRSGMFNPCVHMSEKGVQTPGGILIVL